MDEQLGILNGDKTTLETSGEDVNLHSKRVENMQNYTRNECEKLCFSELFGFGIKIQLTVIRCEIMLETSGADVENTFETSGEDCPVFLRPGRRASATGPATTVFSVGFSKYTF